VVLSWERLQDSKCFSYSGSATLPFVISTRGAQRIGEISVLTPCPGNVFRPSAGLILDGNAEAKLLRLDGILSLCFCQQTSLFGHLLRLRSISQSLISPAKLVIRLRR